MTQLLAQLNPWHWLALAILFGILELLTPASVFIWLSVAAVAVGLLLALIPAMDWVVQVGLFAVFSVSTLLVGRLIAKRMSVATDAPFLNKRGHQYVGRVYTLEAPLVNGSGRVRVDDSSWKIRCERDCAVGERVRVTGVDGVILIVEPVAE